MKTIIFLLLFFPVSFVMTQASPAQQRTSSGSTNDTTVINKAKRTGKSIDRFIDANGDGICDDREQGLGFKREKNQAGRPGGKKQRGRQK